MKLKKSLIGLLITLVLGAPVANVTSNSVQAADSSDLNQNIDGETQIFVIPTEGSSVLNKQALSESKVGTTKVVKTAIKLVLKNRNKLVNAVGKVAGRGAAVKVGNALNKVMPVFRKLSRWESLSYGAVQDQVASALIKSGMKSSTARTLAFWIRQALEWGL